MLETQTYSEVMKHNSFDWRKELKYAKSFGLSKKSWNRLAEWADNWVTCACGNQCAIIPRNINGSPRDMILLELGVKFANEIDIRNPKKALKTLARIEKRSIKLIKKLTKAKNNA